MENFTLEELALIRVAIKSRQRVAKRLARSIWSHESAEWKAELEKLEKLDRKVQKLEETATPLPLD